MSEESTEEWAFYSSPFFISLNTIILSHIGEGHDLLLYAYISNLSTVKPVSDFS